jgi:heme o synthase
VFKLRISVAIMACALAGLMASPGPQPAVWQIVALALAVLLSSASAGACNQYVERDLDAQMRRTRRRPFATGRFRPGTAWLAAIAVLLALSVLAAGLSTNCAAAAARLRSRGSLWGFRLHRGKLLERGR